MTPAEKAKELVEKFIEFADGSHEWAKQCALICVDEVMDSITAEADGLNIAFDKTLYWSEVKEEIEKL